MLYRVQLRELAKAALINAKTMADENLFPGRSLPIGEARLPALYLQIYDDRGESPGPSQVQFERTSTLGIVGYVAGGTPEQAEAKLDIFSEQVELALMKDAPFQSAITQVSEFATQMELTSEGNRHLGVFKMLLGLRYIETYPPDGVALTEIDATVETTDQPRFASAKVVFPSS